MHIFPVSFLPAARRLARSRRRLQLWLGGALFLVAGLGLAMPGHAGSGLAQSPASEPIIVKDLRGKTVRLAAPAQRVVSLLPSLTETVCALQACERLVGIDRYSDWPVSVHGLPRLGGLNDTSVEAIVALRPDLVLLSPASRLATRLEDLGLRAVTVDAQDMHGLGRQLAMVGALLGRSAEAATLWSSVKAQVLRAADQVPAGIRGQTVYFEVSPEPYAAGPVSFVGQMLSALGLANIVPAELGAFPRLNPEFIVLADPQIVMAAGEALNGMRARPGWAGLQALKQNSVCGFEMQTYRWLVRPGPRVGEAADRIAQCLTRLAPVAPVVPR